MAQYEAIQFNTSKEPVSNDGSALTSASKSRAACRSSREDAADGASPVACPAIHYNRGPVQKGLAFRSTSSIGVVVRRGANGARMTQPPPSALADPGLVLVRGSDRPGFQDVRKVGS